ncbi:hypothetical protein [Flavobacterium subsaxonicum]|uniref:Multidrug transporter n=1 Tax=Flavobacterium subsaxonicum WB 4.1-42 = DSM 21790 TaxID=1121898 RepID=A0A0A2MGU6_9FLAO|nr:hypothetical protein [Flavobacterium subsaxonicum]KGO91509.1 hypothetical protein Q766_17415 [Flavobacterium subsaxonicum WB 4.1-42 = DSM 21790]
MKKLFLSLAVLSAVFTSCGDDDSNTTEPIAEAADLTGTISANLTLNEETVYTLKGPVYVENGVTLTIPAGTRIEGYAEADATAVAFLAVKAGGKIVAQGTAADPIIFTSSKAQPAPGDWGGIVVCGNAVTNLGTNVQAEVTGLTYGGTNPADNSGVLSYIRLEYAGALINPEAEFNGFTFYGVGSGTTVNNLLAYQGSDDGFEFFGGSVGGNNLISIGNQDDSFDWTEGWNGTVSNLYSNQAPALAFSSDSRGIEADNNSNNATLAPISNPTLSNITLIGRNNAAVTSEAGIMLRRGTYATISNVYIADFKGATGSFGINFNGNESGAYFTLHPLSNININNVTATSNLPVAYTAGTSTGAGNGAALPSWTSWAGL